jgi:cellulose biosynthesis protein BcsQ
MQVGVIRMIKLIVADRDNIFVNALADFLQREYGHLFDIACFTTEQAIHQLGSSNCEVDILLVDKSLKVSIPKLDNTIALVTLTDVASEAASAVIYKYQSAEQIAMHILEIYDKSSKELITGRKKAECCTSICVYSASGGSGKTMVAYSMAAQYALQEKKVLFLSLEAWCSIPILCKGKESKGLVYLLYLIKNQLPNLKLKLENLKAVDSATGIHYIARESSALEYKDITMADMAVLTDFLRENSDYDVVIIDLDSSVSEITLGAFKYCDAIINIFRNGLAIDKYLDFIGQMSKLSDMLQRDLSANTLHVANMHNASADMDAWIYDNFKISSKIPYLSNPDLCQQTYFMDMLHFKELHDVLESFFIERGK